MSRRSLVLVLVTALAGLAFVTPARAGLLSPLLGGSSGTEADWTLDGKPCRLIEMPTAAPFGVSACPGVRPGSLIDAGAGMCTLNFMFTDPTGQRYMGTAGHCLLATSPLGGEDGGEVTFAPGEGPEVLDGRGQRIGEFAYAVLQDPKDFALIRLDEGVQANPQVCGFGGPTGLNDETSGGLSPTVLSNFGNPLGLGTGVTAKTFVALGMPSDDHVFATGLVLPGDSGGPVLDTAGRAVGVVVSTGLHTGDELLSLEGLDVGLVGITRIVPQLERAEAVMGTDLDLVEAPRL
jgi:hypothetical protein